MKEKLYIEGLGDRLRTVAQEHNTTVTELAKILGCDRKNIYAWMQDRCAPNTYYVYVLCKHYKISSDWLVLGCVTSHDSPTAS